MTIKELESSLAGLREGLVADGYDMEISDEGNDAVKIAVVAGPEACADCLVPKEVMEQIIHGMLDDMSQQPLSVEVVYPRDAIA